MSPFRLALVAVACAAAAGACVPNRARIGPGGVVVSSSRAGWARKKVITKQPPARLLSEDGTGCDVAPDLYGGISVGDVVNCNWREIPP